MRRLCHVKLLNEIPASCAVLALLLLCATVFSPSGTAAEPSDRVSKRFVYYIYWSGIRAGQAVMDYEHAADSVTIRTHATSATFISLFYEVDDRAVSTLYPSGYPKSFVLKIHEGRHRRHKVTRFDLPGPDNAQKVTFHNVLDDEILEFRLDRPAYDPLSAFYAMAQQDVEVGESSYIDIFDNKKLWQTEVQVLRKETVRVPAGEFETIVVKPLLQSEGIFLRKGEMHIWVTDDERKIPVLFTSKAKIGRFIVKLVEGDI